MWGLSQEGDGGVVGRMLASKQGQVCLFAVVRNGRICTSFKEEVDEGRAYLVIHDSLFGGMAGIMKCCLTVDTLHVDNGSNAWLL